MTKMKHLQKSEISQVRILVHDSDETFTSRVNHDLVYEWESTHG